MTEPSEARDVLLNQLADEFAALPARRTPVAAGVLRPAPGIGRRHPRVLARPWPRWSRSRTTPSIAAAAGRWPAAVARTAGRLPHPPRGRPRRHGGRLRGRAGLARPPRGAEGAAAGRSWRTPTQAAVSSARRGRRRGCTTPTSCRSSASASTTARPTTSCSSSRASGCDEVLEELTTDPARHRQPVSGTSGHAARRASRLPQGRRRGRRRPVARDRRLRAGVSGRGGRCRTAARRDPTAQVRPDRSPGTFARLDRLARRISYQSAG